MSLKNKQDDTSKTFWENVERVAKEVTEQMPAWSTRAEGSPASPPLDSSTSQVSPNSPLRRQSV